jgi:hypothetical protein
MKRQPFEKDASSNARNGQHAVKLVGVYVVVKEKPLASPAPAPAQ